MNPRPLKRLLACLLFLSVPSAHAQQSWTPLFNGKDLEGWKTDPKQPGQWKVVNGAIVGTGNAVSHLFSERGDFDSFHLRVEAKISARGDSGVYFRSEYGLSRLGTNPLGYEAQICLPGARQKQLTGSLFGFAPVFEPLVEPDQWFTLEVTGDGRYIDIKVNGKTAVHFKDEKNTYRKGHFALQHVPGSTVSFRRIDVLVPCPAQFRVKETAATVPLLSYFHEGRLDNVTLSTPEMKKTVEAEGYIWPGILGRALKEARKDTAPLLLYKRGDGKEYLTVSTDAGKKAAQDAGYKLVGVQGHVYREPRWGANPLYLYYGEDRKDYFTCTAENNGKNAAEQAGYKLVRTEGYVLPVWRNQPKPWAVILCKFSDKADYEPHPVRFYEEAFTEAGAGKGREFDYFRDVSGGRLDMTGSKVFGWLTMPKQSTQEWKMKPNRAMLHGWAVETAKAKGIDLTPFWGVVALFNQSCDVGAFGRFGESMSVVLSYDKTAWDPNVNCHELGHGFGIDHARLVRPLTEYGDAWDVMGSYIFQMKTKYGEGGPGLNALHLMQLDCIAADRIWTANPEPGSQTITLAALNKFDADGFLMAVIPPALGSKSNSNYVVEFRRKMGWDAGIPQDTVLVHEDRNPWASYLLSRKGSGNLDAMQVLPGQEFDVPERDLTIKVVSFDAAASTAKVIIRIGKPGELTNNVKKRKEYLIVNVQSGRVLDADPASLHEDGTDVRLFGKDAKDAPNRRWNIVEAGKGTVMIANVASGRLLDADLQKIKVDGTGIALYGTDANDRPNRLWKVVNVGKGEVAIVSAMSGRMLDADTRTINKDGTKVTLYGKDVKNMPNRRWRLVE